MRTRDMAKHLAIEQIIELRRQQLQKRDERVPSEEELRQWAEAHHDDKEFL